MRKRAGHKLVLAWVAVALLFITGNVQAASLGKIEVASFLDEPFYGEIPLKLDSDESAAKLLVEIASASEYKIFEVYRDRILKMIRADIISDNRGVRVKLTSRASLQSPFFNLVLKIRYGRVTHFKKFPVFLEQPKSIQMIAKKKPLPFVKAASGVMQLPTASKTVAPKAQESTAPKGYDGWARTGRYGPIVRGDSLSTIAERLRVDHRYTRNQIMAALFEKNRSKFSQNNMNLLKAGSYLDVPKAAEVEHLSKSQAYAVLADHEKRWKQLTKQPRYAAEKEAQRTRYSKRVRIGQQADGVARTAPTIEAPLATPPATETKLKASVAESAQDSAVSEQAQKTDLLIAKKAVGAQAFEDATEESGSSALKIIALRKKNNDLQKLLEENKQLLNQKLSDLQKRLADNEQLLNQKIDSATEVAKAASKAAMEKLEVLVAQLQGRLEAIHKEAQSKQDGSPQWVVWLLAGLVAILLGVVGLLLRREPVHPAAAIDSQKIEDSAIMPETGSAFAPEIGKQVDASAVAAMDADTDSKADSFSATTSDPFEDLTGADTSEMESLDTSRVEVPDPDVDYLAEVDVYIRYGMEDEALQQVNMALRLQPDNVEAHIKKAEILHSSNNSKGFEEAVAVAGAVLVGDALERFRSVADDLKGSDVSEDGEIFDRAPAETTEGLSEQPENDTEASAAIKSGEMHVEDESETDGIDFDIPDVPLADSDGMSQQPEAGEEDTGGMDWLEDGSLPADNFSLNETAGQQSDISDHQEQGQPEVRTEGAIALAGDDEATQEPDSLPISFAEDEENIVLDETADGFNRSIVEEPVNQQSDGQVDVNADHVELTENAPENQMDNSLELDRGEALQQLDHLLSEFSDDNDISTDETVDGLDESIFAQAGQEAGTDLGISMGADPDAIQEPVHDGQSDDEVSINQMEMDRTIDLSDISEGTLEFDKLLSEFSDDEGIDLENTVDGLDESIIEKAEKAPEDLSGETIALDADHASTDDLDNVLSDLLNDFSDDDDDKKG
jgi:FimV-like protein